MKFGRRKGLGAELTALLLALTLLIGLAVPAAADGGEGVAPSQPWTVAVYLCGSDLETRSMSATNDLLEMLRAEFDDSLVNLYVMTGGSWAWDSLSDQQTESESGGCYIRPDAERTQIFRIVNGTPTGEPVEYKPWGDEDTHYYLRNRMELLESCYTIGSDARMIPMNMSSGATLEMFLNDVTDRSPTEHMMVLLWDHGGGPLMGAEMDETYMGASAFESYMPLSEIHAALDKANAYRKAKLSSDAVFDLLGFDCCLMGSLEVAYELRDTADYLLVSEEAEWKNGWEYSWLEIFNAPAKRQALLEASYQFLGESREYDKDNLDPTVPLTDAAFPAEIGKLIINRFPHQNMYYDSHGWSDPAVEKYRLTLALYDTRGIGDSDAIKQLGDAVNDMGAALDALKAKYADSTAVVELVRETEELLEMNTNTGLVDLWSLATLFTEVCSRSAYVADPEARALKNAAEAVCALLGGNDQSAWLCRPDAAVLYRGATGNYRRGIGMTTFYPTSHTEFDNEGMMKTAYRDALEFSRAYPGYADALQRIGPKAQTDFHASVDLSYDEYHHWFFAEIRPDAGAAVGTEIAKLVSMDSWFYYQPPVVPDGIDPEETELYTYTLGTLPVDKGWTNNEFYSRFNAYWPTVNGQLFTVYQKDLEYNCIIPVFVPYEPAPQYSDLIHLYVHAEDVSGAGGRFVVDRALIVGSDPVNTGRSFVPEAGYTFRTMLENPNSYNASVSNEQTALQYDAEKRQVYFDFSYQVVPAGKYFCQFSGYDLSWNQQTSNLLEIRLSGFDWGRFSVDPIPDQAYTGRPVTPTPTVRLDDAPLGADYTLDFEYWDNVLPGTGTVQIRLTNEENGVKGLLWQFFHISEPDAPYYEPDHSEPAAPGEKDGKAEPPFENPFTDVEESSSYYDAVRWAVENGITQGTGKDTFSPNAPCTRAQIVTFLWRAAGCPEPTVTEVRFNDADESAYYCKAVLWANETGVILGANGSFRPDEAVTRQDLVTILCRYAKNTGCDVSVDSGLNAYPDADMVSDYAQEPMRWAVQRGILQDTDDGSLAPGVSATRAQAVAALARLIRNAE